MAVAPEIDAGGIQRRPLVTDAIAGQHRHPVGDRVAAMTEDPGAALAIFFRLRIGGIPADRGWVKQQFGAGQRHQPRGFRVPLVPAHQHAQAADRGVDRREAQIAGGEIEFFVEPRIVRNMHLAVLAGSAAVRVEHHGGVVIQTSRTPLEQRAHQHHAVLFRKLAQALGAWAGDRFGQIEFVDRFVLAEIGAVMQFLQQHEFCAAFCGFANARFDDREIGLGIALVLFLDQRDRKGGALVHTISPSGSCMVMQCRLPFCQINGRQGTGTIARPGKASDITSCARASATSP